MDVPLWAWVATIAVIRVEGQAMLTVAFMPPV